ncbi:MAG: DEAD/DEAH box helicase, partial [Alphaproteobacteria bacterium]
TDDQSAPVRMLRLLQGDVGSGKTLVALIALLRAITSGKQAALLAPTEILSKQHFENITKLLKDFDIEPVLLIGSMTQKQKQVAHEGLKSGTISFVIGTHALLTENAEFADLGLAVVDEQHRVGVKQRLILGQKGGG